MIIILIVQCVLLLLVLFFAVRLVSICVYDRDEIYETLKKAVALIDKLDKKQEMEDELVDFISNHKIEDLEDEE